MRVLNLFFGIIFCIAATAQNKSYIVQDKSLVLKSIYLKDKATYNLKFSNPSTYNLLKEWTDEAITKKYTAVKGIKVFKLNRNIPGEIYAEIDENNATFLIENYLNISSEQSKKIVELKIKK